MLFGKKKSLNADPGKIWAIDPEPVVDYNSVMEWLVGLSGADYTKVCQVAAINRQADFESCKVLGVECEPTTFIKPPEPVTQRMSITNADPVFLEHELKPKKKAPKK